MPANPCLHCFDYKKERECSKPSLFLNVFSQLISGRAVKCYYVVVLACLSGCLLQPRLAAFPKAG
jgi:hypothetical protein